MLLLEVLPTDSDVVGWNAMPYLGAVRTKQTEQSLAIDIGEALISGCFHSTTDG